MIKLNTDTVKPMLPRRDAAAHKGSFGRLTIVAGSLRYRGAALLCAEAALRCGTGIVQLAATEPVCAAAAARLPCCTLLPLAHGSAGDIGAAAAGQLDLGWPTAVLAGCGMGQSEDTAALVAYLLQHVPCPLVLDADALNVLAQSPDMLALVKKAQGPVVVTPHIGEMARLCGLQPGQVAENQQKTAQGFAAQHRCVVVLKSHITVVAAPDGSGYINDEAGNPGLAKGGSGDVLAGAIAALAAQGLPAQKAAAAGVWLHAAAADALAADWGYTGLSPAGLPTALAGVFKSLGL